MENVNVISAPLPFSNHQVRSLAPLGVTIDEIVKAEISGKYEEVVDVIVLVNGQVVPFEYWKSVRPRLGTIVNIRAVPKGGGGGGGKKNPISTLLSVAVMVAAPYIAGAILGPGIIASTQLGAMAISRVVTGIVGVVGNLAISALSPPPKQSYAGGGGLISNPSESPTLFIEGARNSITPYGAVPVCLGTNRVFPLQAAKPYTEIQNNDQYVRQLFTYGFADSVVFLGRNIGDTPIENFTDIDFENFHEGNLHTGGRLWSNSVLQNDFSILLSKAVGWVQRTVPLDSDETIVDYTFPRGLTHYNDQGKRTSLSVQLEMQYRAVGDVDWIGGAEFFDYSGGVFSIPPPILPSQNDAHGSVRKDIVVINDSTGEISYITGAFELFTRFGALISGGRATTPSGALKLANVDVDVDADAVTVYDTRTNYIGIRIEGVNDFKVTKTDDFEITVADGRLTDSPMKVTAATSEALLRSYRIVFPERGDYEIRARRITKDRTSAQSFDEVNLTAIRGVRYEAPVNSEGLSGVALRIKATDQLNGIVDTFNEIIVNIVPDYDAETETWVDRATSNPASLYRYVLQGSANANALPDSKIDIEALEEWHVYCDERGYTCDIVIDYETSVEDTLALISSAGSATPSIVDGKRSVVVDRAGKDVTQVITPRNSWGYQGEMLYPEIPHAFRVIFRNRDVGYQQDERIVYADGYDASNATLFETLELRHCTNADLAYKHARRYLATALLRPETHTFMMDVENIVSLRGDRVKFEHDIPLIGVGDGRVKDILLDSSGDVVSLTLDDTIAFPSTGVFYVRIRYQDGSQAYKSINASQGYSKEIMFTEPLDFEDAPSAGDLCYVTTAGGELDLVIKSIQPLQDLTARIVCVNYAPEIFDAETGDIPSFESNITTPLDFIRPSPPILINAQSDESVMIRNIDGSFTSVIILSLKNTNDGNIEVDVKVRISGGNVFTSANIISSTPEKVVITGLDDGTLYDIYVRYEKLASNLYSEPLQLNNYLFIGSSGPPSDVENFKINVSGQTGIFTWDANEDIDFSHYIIKFSSTNSGATWETSQLLEDFVNDNRISLFAQSGTYLIKAVDLSDNESLNATALITTGLEDIINAVAILEEDPAFTGEKDNTTTFNGLLRLADLSLGEGYYYFEERIDLTDVYSSIVSATLLSNGVFANNIFSMDDIFEVPNIFGSQGDNDIFDMVDLFQESDIFGIGADAWEVEIQIRVTDDDPVSSFVEWSEWSALEAGTMTFRAAEFRAWLRSFDSRITPSISKLSVNVDMPDRIERGEDLTVPTEGLEILYSPMFKGDPAVSILIQDGDADDEVEFVYKSTQGFEFKIYNKTSSEYVERSCDFISSGYGRVIN